MPLLACVLGPIEGYCTADDLKLAAEWWTAALPAWGRWVSELNAAGLPACRGRILASTKGRPSPLIPRFQGCGTFPHVKGREQVEALELSPAIATEVYAMRHLPLLC